MVASCDVFVPVVAVGAVGVPVKAGEAESTAEPVPVEVVTPVPPDATGKAAENEAEAADKAPVNVPVVPLTEAAVVAPTVVPFIAPPVIATLLAFCVAIVPRPRAVVLA